MKVFDKWGDPISIQEILSYPNKIIGSMPGYLRGEPGVTLVIKIKNDRILKLLNGSKHRIQAFLVWIPASESIPDMYP